MATCSARSTVNLVTARVACRDGEPARAVIVFASARFPNALEINDTDYDDMAFVQAQFYRKTSIERTILEKYVSCTEPVCRSIFARKIFWKLSLSESETTYPKLKSDSFSLKSVDRIARYLHFCENIFGKSASHSRHELPCVCSIKYCSSSNGYNLRLYKRIS